MSIFSFFQKSLKKPNSSDDNSRPETSCYPKEPPASIRASDSVTWGVRVSAEWAWRLLVILAVAWILLKVIGGLSAIVVPIIISLLFTAILAPLARFMTKKLRFPRGIAAAVAMLIGLSVAALIATFSITQIVAAAPDLATRAASGFQQLTAWLSKGPLNLEEHQVTQWVSQGVEKTVAAIRTNAASIASGAFVYAQSAISVLATGVTVLFCLFFFLMDGKTIWLWCVRLFPRPARRPLHESVSCGWRTVGAWARVQVLVAAIDATGIGMGAFFLGTSLWIPIALLTFMMTFIPILGAFIAGGVAIMVVLVDVSPTAALIMLIIVLVVQQLEGNVLQPILMSSAVSLHPVAVVLGVTAGGYLAGIMGALFVMPLMAFVNEAVKRAISKKSRENHTGVSDKELGLVLCEE
ncbi:AI-2E family transporter [Actinomycetaceae bacterium TAE3-ERU4]|nr:AI-2E family transporter [Actinomycetaceae bacterium TAE3-ERU4]